MRKFKNANRTIAVIILFLGIFSVKTIDTRAQCYQGDAGEDKTVCQESTTLNAVNPETKTGVWSTPGNATIVNPTLYDTEILNLDHGLNYFVWYVEQKECESVKDTVIITNNSVTKAEAGNNSFACTNDSMKLSANQPIYGTGKWTVREGAGVFINPTLYNTSVINLNPRGNRLQWTISNDDCSSKDTVIIYNYSASVADIYTENQKICVDTILLNANDPDISDGKWTLVEGNGNILDENSRTTIITNLAKGTNLFEWSITNVVGCNSYDTVAITNLSVDAITSGDLTACKDTISLNAQKSDFGKGQWTIETGQVAILTPSKYNSLVTNIHYGTNRLRWTVSSSECEASTVITLSNKSFQSKFHPQMPTCDQCNGIIAVETWSGIEPYNFEWEHDAGLDSDTAQSLCPGVYKVTITDNNKVCEYTKTIELHNQGNISDPPEILGRDSVYEYTKRIRYSTNSISDNYEWSVIGGKIITNQDTSVVVNWDAQTNDAYIALSIDTECGVVDNTLDIIIQPLQESTPNQNICTPDGDGFDDEFKILELENSIGDFPNNELFIYDRNGSLVHHASPYKNNWEGVSSVGATKGSHLPSGTYYYIFRFDKNLKKFKSGYIILMK